MNYWKCSCCGAGQETDSDAADDLVTFRQGWIMLFCVSPSPLVFYHSSLRSSVLISSWKFGFSQRRHITGLFLVVPPLFSQPHNLTVEHTAPHFPTRVCFSLFPCSLPAFNDRLPPPHPITLLYGVPRCCTGISATYTVHPFQQLSN